MGILKIISCTLYSYMIYLMIELITGFKKKHGYIFIIISLLFPAAASLLVDEDLVPQIFIIRLAIIIMIVFGKYIAYSLIFNCFRVNVLYISVLSIFTNQTYSTILCEFISDPILLDIVSMTLESVFLLIIYFVIKRKNTEIYIRQSLAMIPRSQYLIIMIMLILMNVFIWSSFDPRFYSLSRVIMIPTMIGFITVIVHIVHSTISSRHHKTLTLMLSEQLDNQVEYYQKINQVYSEFRSFKHDFNNHIICIKSLIQENATEKALDYLNDIEYTSSLEKKEYDTGNVIVNSLLSIKKSKIADTNIKIVFNGFVPTMGIKDSDCCIIFANALDNAIEACMKDTSDEPKEITICSDFRQGYYFLKITNPIFEKPSFDVQNNLVTSKNNKEIHGFGISNIINTVHKYDGTVDIKIEDGMFCLDIVVHLNNEHIVQTV